MHVGGDTEEAAAADAQHHHLVGVGDEGHTGLMISRT